MPTLHLLGTGAAVSDPHRTTTMLGFSDFAAEGPSTVLVDCGADVLQRFLAADGSFDDVAGLILTHAHPDHVSGFPLFMEKIWLAGRERPLPVHGIAPALDQAKRTFDAFSLITADWDLPPIEWHTVAHESGAVMWGSDPWHITSAPVEHGDTPNVGLRTEHRPSGRVVAYSCDTDPCDAVVELARNANILVHEANGDYDGHSTAQEAAEIARRAGAERLILVHLPPGDKTNALAHAQTLFGATELGAEGASYPI